MCIKFKSTLGARPGPDNEHTNMLNAGFCILCINDFKIIKIFDKL